MFVRFWLESSTGGIEEKYFWEEDDIKDDDLSNMLEDWKDKYTNYYRRFNYNYEKDVILPENILLKLQNKYIKQVEQAEEIKQRTIAEAKDMLDKLEQHKKLCLLK